MCPILTLSRNCKSWSFRGDINLGRGRSPGSRTGRMNGLSRGKISTLLTSTSLVCIRFMFHMESALTEDCSYGPCNIHPPCCTIFRLELSLSSRDTWCNSFQGPRRRIIGFLIYQGRMLFLEYSSQYFRHCIIWLYLIVTCRARVKS